jgi:hypothetical protein
MVHNKSLPLNKLVAFSYERQYLAIMKHGKDNGMHMEKFEKMCDFNMYLIPLNFFLRSVIFQNQIAP